MSEQFDLIVLGGGSAARDGANKAAREHGARVALVERERWGGSCPNVACTPTKAYLVAAELAHDVNALAPQIGIDAGPATVDLARVRARKDSLKKPQDQWVSELMDQGFAAYTGEASFLDAHRVQERRLARVGGEALVHQLGDPLVLRLLEGVLAGSDAGQIDRRRSGVDPDLRCQSVDVVRELGGDEVGLRGRAGHVRAAPAPAFALDKRYARSVLAGGFVRAVPRRRAAAENDQVELLAHAGPSSSAK